MNNLRILYAVVLVLAGTWAACSDDGDPEPMSDMGSISQDSLGADTGNDEDTLSGVDTESPLDGVLLDSAEPIDVTGADVGIDADAKEPDSGEWVDTNDPPTGAYIDTKLLEADQTLEKPGLQYKVYISKDHLGIPHILASSLHDALFAQGYVQAVDRYAQMELFRRNTSGTLAKLAGALDPGAVDDDIFARMMGFRRIAQVTYDSLADGSAEKVALDAFAAGVNAFVDELKAGQAVLPGAAALLVNLTAVEPWSPVDGLTLARFQMYRLGFDGFSEISDADFAKKLRDAFPADSPDQTAAKRAAIFQDLARFAPADPTYQMSGFAPNGKGAHEPLPPALPTALPPRFFPDAALIQQGLTLLEGFKSVFAVAHGPGEGASNSWVVSGNLMENGHAVMANDPHLENDSPALFYQQHIVVEPKTPEDGPALNVFGASFPGLPGVLIGHNEHVAWGLTTASYDYSDVFMEELVWVDGEEWPRVKRNGQNVKLDIYEEEIEIGFGGVPSDKVTVQIPWVPGRGPLSVTIKDGKVSLPEGNIALSFGWRGFEPSDEFIALVRWMTAKNVDEVQESLQFWQVGTQNLVFADTSGNILATAHSYIPNRPPAAKTWDAQTNPDGWAPWWPLMGTGEHDWIVGGLPLDQVPYAKNPPEGFVVTANNDQIGVTDDNNPLNDGPYLGNGFDIGFRAGRITRRLTNATQEFPEGHKLTLDDIGAIQHDTFSSLGERLSPFMVQTLQAAVEEADNPGSHPALSALVSQHADKKQRIVELRDLLAAWNFEAEDGRRGEVTPEQIQHSAATSLFNFWTVAVSLRAFGDEQSFAGVGFGDTRRVKALLLLLETPQQAATYDPETQESALWDDMSTGEVVETKDFILLDSFFVAEAKLVELFKSENITDWRWGDLHGKTFKSLIPDLSGGVSPFTLPQPQEGFVNGYPRPGDNFAVNVCNGGLGDYTFTCGGGPILRLIVEMDPDGVRSFNALPGGQRWYLDSPHFKDLLTYWLDHERYAVPFHPQDVLSKNDTLVVLSP